MPKLVIGCGYLGERVAQLWRSAGERVFTVTRKSDRARQLAEQGFQPLVADVTQPDSLQQLPVADTLLYAVGRDRQSGKSMRDVYIQGLQHVLGALPAQCNRIIYISSTGVYGQTDGQWVDEGSVCEPNREGGQVCLAAEQRLRSDPVWGPRSVVLRLAGIYGPGRIPRRSELVEGAVLQTAADGYLNLIHVDDAARVVLAAESRAVVPALFTVSDGQPVQRRTFYEYLAQLLGTAEPALAPPDLPSGRQARSETNKRVSNRRVLQALQITLQYPSYREGLPAAV